jgi:Tfp pilus assembly protein PilF
VIEVNPARIDAYDLLARLYLKQRRLDAARSEYEQIALRQPRSVGAHTFIGMIWEAQGKSEEAKSAYRRALDVQPGAAVAANNLAYIYAQAGEKLDEALALAKAAAENLKDEATVLDTVGWVYYKRGQMELAIPQFRASIQKDARNPLFQYHLGLAYLKSGDRIKARQALEEALRINTAFEGAEDAKRTLASLTS